MSQFFSGINVSTQSQKIVVLDLENDSIIYSDSIMWIDGLHLLFKKFSKKTDFISSIKSLSSSISLKIRGLEGPNPFNLRKKFFKN